MSSELMVITMGTPRPLPRHRDVGHAVSLPRGSDAWVWSQAVERAARRVRVTEPRVDGVFGVGAWFMMPTETAKRWGEWHTATPDVDNLLKLALDAVKRAGLVKDDRLAQITRPVLKVWSTQRDAGMWLVIERDPALILPASRPQGAPEWLNGEVA